MKVKIPGKLFINGEYGVVHGSHAILAPSKAYMYFDITHSNVTTIHSEKFNDTFYPNTNNPMPSPIKNGVQIANAYLALKAIPKRDFNLHVSSDLDYKGKKLGLGSSAALTTGIIKSVLQFHHVEITDLKLYKLCVLSSIDEIAYNSYGDVALTAFNKWILYKKFDANWLKKKAHLKLDVLLDLPWKGLLIEPFIPKTNPFIMINTLRPAKSKLLVEAFNKALSKKDRFTFINTIDALTLTMVKHLKEGGLDEATFLKSATLFQRLQKQYGLKLITNTMVEINALLKDDIVGFKISGAGGGDNIIVLPKHPHNIPIIIAKLQEKGFPTIELKA